MKKILLIAVSFALLPVIGFSQEGRRQETKKETKAEAKERHKQFWKKVGNDQRDFWKGEHEKHVAKEKERKARKAEKDNGTKKAGDGAAEK